jgi:hypothetical protein
MVPSMLAKIPPLQPPHDLLAPSFWEQNSWLVIAIGSLGLALVGLGLWWRTRPKTAPALSPGQQIGNALLSWRDRPANPQLPTVVVRLVRQFAADAFALPPGELTTEEVDQLLASHPDACAHCRQALNLFLRANDARLFAPQPDPIPANLVAEAFELLDMIETHRTPRATPPRVPGADPTA